MTLAENIGVGNVENIHDKSAIEKAAAEAGADDFIEKLPFKYESYLGSIPGSWTWTEGIKMWNQDDVEDDNDESDEVKELQKMVQSGLSGGQLQKLGLARSFMRGADTDFMILDEPSAKLDPEAESKLFETIKKTRSGRTTVFISHRFNTVKLADQILVIDGGVIKESGTHDELMAIKDSKYRRLYSIQASGFTPEDVL
jgi:ATP-binding cassette, subfamily B, bacterial